MSATITARPWTVSWWQDRLYPDTPQRDPVVRFVELVGRYVNADARVLDIGAGAGERNPYAFRGRCREMIGVDLDPRVADNPLLDRGLVADAASLPLPDASVDVAFSIYVLEHVDDPERFVGEVHRVLAPGGVFLAITPNRFHYVPLIASLTPTRFHQWFNRLRGREATDTFPTRYRMNSRGRLAALFGPPRFTVEHLELVEVQPNYLLGTLPSFLAGAAYERLVNASPLLAGLRVNILAGFRKGR